MKAEYIAQQKAEIERQRYKRHKSQQPFKWKCTRVKHRAKVLGVPFDLTPEYIENLWTGYCPISHVKLEWDTDRTNEQAAELDRIVPNKGYVKGNVVFISRRMNRLKNNATWLDLYQLANWLKEKERCLDHAS